MVAVWPSTTAVARFPGASAVSALRHNDSIGDAKGASQGSIRRPAWVQAEFVQQNIPHLAGGRCAAIRSSGSVYISSHADAQTGGRRYRLQSIHARRWEHRR